MKIKKIYTDHCPLNPCGQGGIEFDDDSILVDIHEQDCCENVYADFSNLDSDIMSYNFGENIRIKNARYGFKFGDGRRWFFVPCYNCQNGYYSDNLDIAYGKCVKKIARYSKGNPVYEYKFIPVVKLESCSVKDDIY